MERNDLSTGRRHRQSRMDTAYLRQIPLFSCMTEEQLEKVVQNAIWRVYDRGNPIVQPAEVRGRVIIVLEGEVRIGGTYLTCLRPSNQRYSKSQQLQVFIEGERSRETV